MLLGFLIFVVLLSGLVAYSADTIARRTGRRHLRWFGLRPKTTALIVAVLSGMGISLASVLAYGLLNRTAIRNIQQADSLRIELAQLKKDIQAAATDLSTAEQERDEANTRAMASRRETAQALSDLQSAETRLKTTQTARTRLQGEVGDLQSKVKELSALRSELEAKAAKNRAALATSQAALEASNNREQQQALRLNLLSTQIVELDTRSAQAVENARAAQANAAKLQTQTEALRAQTQTLRAQTLTLGAQTQALEQSRAKVQGQLEVAQVARNKALTERDTAQKDRQTARANRDAALKAQASAVQARDIALAQQASLAAERDQLISQRATLAAQRDAAAEDLGKIRTELSTLQTMVGSLESQRRALSDANEALRSSLSSAQANLTKLTVDFSRTSTELSANRNTDLIYSRNDLVYAGVVPSVRSVPDFLKAVTAAAQQQGARGTPPAQLTPQALVALEAKLRGFNTSTFVLCRAAINVAQGFPVDLTCDARPQAVLFKRGEVIRQTRINLQLGTDGLSNQLTKLTRDAVFALTSRGVPPEYINDLGLSDRDRLDLLGKLGAQSGDSALVSLAAREDVRLGSRVDLYSVVAETLGNGK